MQDLFSIFDILRKPIHQTQLFNPNWEKDHFLEAAIKASGGLKNFGNEVLIEGLEALLSSIRDLKKKHLIGEITLYTLILRSLKNRLQFMNYINKKGFENWSLNTPVIITGVSRSGTTFLHRLLSLNDDFYAFPLWELSSPYKKPGSMDIRRLKTSIEIQIKNILLPELDKKHYTRAQSTEECIMLLANSFSSQLFTDIAPVPQYLQWLIAADRLYTYQEYGDQLKILQSFHPGKRFVLKAPNHLGNFKELLTCIPDAIVIQMHRSPEECSSSLISLSKSKYKMVINEINIREIQNLTFHLFDSELKKNLEFHLLQKDRIISLSYNAFISDPLTSLHGIYEKVSLNWTKEIEELSKKFVHLNPKSRRGIYKYRHSINREEIPASFTNYKSYFRHYL